MFKQITRLAFKRFAYLFQSLEPHAFHLPGGESEGSDPTANPNRGSDHDVLAVLRDAFADWSAAVNINFVQVKDNKAKIVEGLGRPAKKQAHPK